MSNFFRSPPPDANEVLVQRETLEELRKGVTSGHCSVEGYLCKQGEKTIFFFKGVKHYRSATHSERVGRSAGASFRIAKGFWIRTGGSEGYSVQHSSMDHQGDGMLILTNKAIAFIGAASTRIPFTKILAFEAFTDGFSLHTDYTRNNKHMFGNVHPQNMIFLRSALGLMSGREEVSPPNPDDNWDRLATCDQATERPDLTKQLTPYAGQEDAPIADRTEERSTQTIRIVVGAAMVLIASAVYSTLLYHRSPIAQNSTAIPSHTPELVSNVISATPTPMVTEKVQEKRDAVLKPPHRSWAQRDMDLNFGKVDYPQFHDSNGNNKPAGTRVLVNGKWWLHTEYGWHALDWQPAHAPKEEGDE